MRPGWRLMAVGGARRSAYNAGIRCGARSSSTYVWSSVLCCARRLPLRRRLGSTGADTGVGLEITALTAAVLGGNSLGGGRGSVAKAVMGAIIVLIMTNGLIRLRRHGAGQLDDARHHAARRGVVDMRWLKNRHKVLNKVYVSPAYLQLPPRPRPRRIRARPTR